MKIDFVLTACNNNEEYLKMFPYIFKVWKKRFDLDCYLILIMDQIPSYLNDYKEFIIMFKPIEDINTIFIAQNIRILYPALFDNKNILITDLDIVPISKNYFIESIKDFKDDTFITYTDRYLENKMLAICYNVANSKTWKEIFNINSIEDINNKLKDYYKDNNYIGLKNSDGWFTDQIKLYENVFSFKQKKPERVFILKDKDLLYNRLDKRTKDIIKIIENSKILMDNLHDYSDIHLSKRIWKRGNYQIIIKKILDILST